MPCGCCNWYHRLVDWTRKRLGMGVSVSRTRAMELRRHKEIEARINEDRLKQQSSFKLLLLGPGESGKSTIVKQMRILHAGGFSDEEVEQQRFLVAQNTLSNMAAIIRAMKTLKIAFEDMNRAMEAAAILKTEENWSMGQTLSAGEWSCMKLLWADSGVQECFRRSNEYQLADSSKYFFDEMDRIAQPSYLPTYEDILRTRASTLGIVEITFPFRDIMLTIIDVGGQRSQRKKWIHCFEGVNCLIYVTSLSEYNQVLFEDSAVNRMQEALKLFGTVCNCQWFRLTPIILFLNKKDIFAEKLATSPLKNAFPDYTGENSFEPCAKFVDQEFQKRRENQAKDVYTHRTCATDTKNVEFVMGSCLDMILSKNMKQAGFAWLVQV